MSRKRPIPQIAPPQPTVHGAVAVLVLLLAGEAAAIDGRVDVRATHQEGRAGALSYTTDALREVYGLGERLNLSRNLFFTLDAVVRRETLESRNVLATTNSDLTTLLPNFSLTYRSEPHRLGLSGRGIRTDRVRTGLPDLRDEYVDLNLWYNGDYGDVSVDASAKEAASWRYSAGGDRENREHDVNATAIWDASDRDQLLYRFTRSKQDAVNRSLETTFTTNNLQYRGDHAFSDRRGQISVYALANHFRQHDKRDAGFNLVYVQPAFAGFTLDDTPEFLDPLEDDPVTVDALIDNDRDTPTQINIGDNAPVVREFGGDYRNIIIDFGEPEAVSELVLYVDRIVSFPGLMQWALYASDDPEGRDWSTRLSPANYTLTYFENETGRQGWRVEFDAAVVHRRLKMVNVKIGPTEPDLFVTEFEPYAESTSGEPERTSNILNSRLNVHLSYELTDRLTALLSTNITDRHFDDDERDLRGYANVAGLTYRMNTWMLMGQYETHQLRGSLRQNTDANSQILSLSRAGNHRLTARFAYHRTEDKSFTNQHLTHSLSADASWRAAPLLIFTQKVAYGLRDDPTLDDMAESWALVTEVRGTPRPSVTFQLRRADRWVNQAAGSGFTTFNDTDLVLTWAPLPLVQLSSQAVYQQREEEDDWYNRNTLTWTPLPGGSMLLRFQGFAQRDTRIDYWQRGAGASVTWKPRPKLMLSASVEKNLVKQFGETNEPVNYQLRGTWLF